MSIRWDEFGPRRYEDVVSVLLSRLYPNAQRIDGKGGDGGRDVQITLGQDGSIAHAFELKSFTGRMNYSRRRQVASSLKRAADLQPAKWSLVVPIDPTPSEENWFRQLGSTYSFPTTWFGKTWLDEKLSAFPDIRRYFVEGAKDEVFRLLRELREEHAGVTDVHDVLNRLRTLHFRLNEIDPHYRYELSTGTVAASSLPEDVGQTLSVSFGDVRVDLYPKYQGAVKDHPITASAKIVVGPGYELVRNSLDYGLPVAIPSHLISSVTVDAPSGLGGLFTGMEIDILSSAKKLDEPVTLVLNVTGGAKLLASLPVNVTDRTTGSRGSIIMGTDSTGWLKTRLTLNVEASKLTAEFRLAPRPELPSALVPLFRWLDACQPMNQLAIRWPSGSETHSEIGTAFLADESPARLVEALAYLQGQSGTYWQTDLSLTGEEAREIVAACALMKGESVDFRWKSLDLSLERWGPQLEELVIDDQHSFICEYDAGLELEGTTIPLGRVRTYIESARLADLDAAQQALASGSAAQLRLLPGDSDKAQQVVVLRP